MRARLALLAAAALLAACKVEVEGAACAVDDQCPHGQGCGNDGRCSTRAAACLDRCRPASGAASADRRCAATRAGVEACAATDPVCGQWTEVEACGDLDCDPGVAEPACRCPARAGAVVWVDPVAGGTDGAHPPTGAAGPPRCRLGTLGEALGVAAGLGGGGTVQLAGDAPVVLGPAETFPVRIGAGLAVKGAGDAGHAADFVLRRDAATGAIPVVVLARGASLEGLTVESVSATAPVVDLDCAGEGPPAAIRTSVLDGGGAASAGVQVAGACGIDLTDVVVRANGGPGLLVRPSDAAVTVSVTRGAFESSGAGVWIDAGRLAASGQPGQPLLIRSNRGHGVVAGQRSALPVPPLALALAQALVEENGETGIALQDLPPDSAVSLEGVEVRSNRTTTSASTGGAPGRMAGGLVLRGAPPASFTFHGNLVRGNDGDEVGVVSDVTWDLSGVACDDGTRNVFTCPGPSAPTKAYAIVSTGAQVKAQHDDWGATWPGDILLGVDYGAYCGTPAADLPPCP